MTPGDKLAIIFVPWAGAMLLDYFFHQIGFNPGPWKWKRSLLFMGIGMLVSQFVFRWILQ